MAASPLIAIGQIAKRYQLYSATGGQRTTCLARLEQLPAIWARAGRRRV
ncbi:hypothetical protein MJ584_16815 [Klebsiella pneumoniae]|nr:hypothetical protein MJ584_16815 [Klebsiella pneumoniae]